MAESATAMEIHWFDPPMRAIIPLDNSFHVSRSLKKEIRKRPFTVKLNTAFGEVIRACSAPAPDRPTTWINSQIISAYTTLHHRGLAHSVEVWEGRKLVGGLFGVNLGSAFFGESMFSRKTSASKIALVYLVALLKAGGFTLLDTQFQTDHLAQFGTQEITRTNYHHLLNLALNQRATLAHPKDWDHLVEEFLHPTTQRS